MRASHVPGREQVSNELRQVLQDKEGLLNEAAGLFRESEALHAARREAFLTEKADLEAELEVEKKRVHEFEIAIRITQNSSWWKFVGKSQTKTPSFFGKMHL